MNFDLLLILLVQLMKAVMEDEEIVEGFKMALDQVRRRRNIHPDLLSSLFRMTRRL